MATVAVSRFTRYILSEEETTVASIFTPLNYVYFQNLRSEEADKLLNLKFDPEKPHDFAQEHAYHSGQLAILDHLIGDNHG